MSSPFPEQLKKAKTTTRCEACWLLSALQGQGLDPRLTSASLTLVPGCHRKLRHCVYTVSVCLPDLFSLRQGAASRPCSFLQTGLVLRAGSNVLPDLSILCPLPESWSSRISHEDHKLAILYSPSVSTPLSLALSPSRNIPAIPRLASALQQA